MYNFLTWETTINDYWSLCYFSYVFSFDELDNVAVYKVLGRSLAYSDCLNNSVWFHLYGYVFYLYGGLNRPYIVTKPWLYQEDIFYQTIVDYIPNALPRPIRWFFQLLHNPTYALRRLYTEGNFYTRQFMIYDRPVERLYLECWDQKQAFHSEIPYKSLFYKYIVLNYENKKEDIPFVRYFDNEYRLFVNKQSPTDKLFFNNLRNLEFTFSNYLPHHLEQDFRYIVDTKELKKRVTNFHFIRYLRFNNNYRYTRSYARADAFTKMPYITLFALHLLPIYIIMIFSLITIPRTRKDARSIRTRYKKQRRGMRIYFLRFKKYFTESEQVCLGNVMFFPTLRFKKFWFFMCVFALPLVCFLLF